MTCDVRFITKHWEHHSAHSGYEQIMGRLGHPIELPDLMSFRGNWVPGRVAVRLARRSGSRHYSHLDFYAEWAAARHMFGHGRSTIYHILYGEQGYRYLGDFAKILGGHVIVTYHQPPAILTRDVFSLAPLRAIHKIIVVGTNQIPFFEAIVGPERVVFVPHGIDVAAFCPVGEPGATDTTRPTCLFVGTHLRDFQMLREVIRLVSAQEAESRFVLVTHLSRLDAFADLPNVELFAGISEEELVRLYRTAHLLLQPMEDCTANNAVLEGLACGLPVVVTDIGGIRDYVNDACGILVPPENAEAMAAAVLQLMRDEETRRQLAARARQHALRFDWALIADEMRRVYAQALAET